MITKLNWHHTVSKIQTSFKCGLDDDQVIQLKYVRIYLFNEFKMDVDEDLSCLHKCELFHNLRFHLVFNVLN